MSCCSFVLRTKTASGLQNLQLSEETSGIGKVKLYTYKELRVATGDFKRGNRIGEGGFGSVYKGTLRNGTIVAIKVLSKESAQGAREFLTEITAISDIIHENLVQLYGCCIEGNHRILVYSYLENNSLAQTLLGRNRSNIQFSWVTRSKICIGVARGLAFLHEEHQPHIVHRDIKASNVLLDKNLNPKISDFGFARLLPSNATHISTGVAGTLGYLAPEYAIRGQATRKSDVYSYGVLLLEIVSGRCNANTGFSYGERFLLERIYASSFECARISTFITGGVKISGHLVSTVKYFPVHSPMEYMLFKYPDAMDGILVLQTWAHYERGTIERMIDSSLAGDVNTKEACKFLKVGLLCTQDACKLRPSMSLVVKMLTGVINVESENITQPGLVTDFMQMKI